MMTDAQMEAAARELCRLRGQNADELIGHGAQADERGFTPMVCLYSLRWELAAKELRNLEALQQAIAHGVTYEPG